MPSLVEDLDVFFDVDEFAVTVILDDDGSMAVIFDRAHIEAMGAGQGIDATQPIALARSSDVAGNQIRAGSTLHLPTGGQAQWGAQEFWGGTVFTVRGIEPDGTGLTLLVLEAP